ncbi:MAG: Fe-S-containing hydro-lyase [Actinobacteria bacterium]|nr:Fe-S-containing hydro-lyase [Actinomycetota bacterium]
MITITPPLDSEMVKNLKAGDEALISGTVYTARDEAHKRFFEAIMSGYSLPIDIRGQIIYYAGPTPPKPDKEVGSIGPTTSGRMDFYTPLLLKHGLNGMIGKGLRSPEVKKAMMNETAVYFSAIGGVAALLAKHVVKSKVVAYEDLGPEAVFELSVEEFPVFVAVDCYGGDIYEEGKKCYKR